MRASGEKTRSTRIAFSSREKVTSSPGWKAESVSQCLGNDDSARTPNPMNHRLLATQNDIDAGENLFKPRAPQPAHLLRQEAAIDRDDLGHIGHRVLR